MLHPSIHWPLSLGLCLQPLTLFCERFTESWSDHLPPLVVLLQVLLGAASPGRLFTELMLSLYGKKIT